MNRIVNRLITLLLMLLCTFSLTYLILDTVGCHVSELFPYWLGLICAAIWCVAYLKRGIWIGLPGVGILIYLIYRFYGENLKNQFVNFCDRITGVFAENILYRGQNYTFLNSASDCSILFLILGFLIAGYAAMSLTSQGMRTNLALMGSAPFFVLCIIVNENPPVAAVLGMLLYWFLTAAGGDVYKEDSQSGFAAAVAAVPIALLLAALLLLINPKDYEYQEPKYAPDVNFENLLQKADEVVSEYLSREDVHIPEYISAPVQTDGRTDNSQQSDTDNQASEQIQKKQSLIWQGESGVLDLTQNVKQEDLQEVFLKVRASQSGALYLRGQSFGDYTGTGWLPADENAVVSSLTLTAHAAEASGGEKQAASVQSLSKSAYRFMPYFSLENAGLDSYVPAENEDRYDLDYFSFPASPGELLLPEQFSETEQTYREYAHSVYTRLPDSTRSVLLSLCSEAGLSPDRDDLIPAVAAYIQSQGVYDLDTEPYLTDDYAVYFLTTAHRGYCIHFATAAAAVYRALGIPARVTEGFLAESQAGKMTEVTGADAHAWVEIYQDGLGWLPVEVTGQSGLNSGILGPTEVPAEKTASPEDPEEGDSTVPEEAPGRTPEPDPTPQLPVGIITQSSLSEDEENSSAGLLWILIPVTMFVLVAGVLIRRLIMLGLRRRRFMQSDTNRASVEVYRAARKASLFGEKVPEIIRVTAERAVFSSHTIKEEEIETCRREYYTMTEKIYSRLKPLQKIRFKYFQALI